MKLSIIIVNYNVKYFLEQALLSVRNAIRHIDAEIFVVDNNSVDDSCRMVAQKFPSVKLIQNKSNPGFSIANNQAIQQSKGEYVLLLNPDTVVEEDTFEKCITFMNTHLDVGGLGVKMIDGSGRFLPESKRGFPSPFVAFCKTFGLSRLFPKSRIFGRYHLGFLDKNIIPENELNKSSLLTLLVKDGNNQIVVKDIKDKFHFNGLFHNASCLVSELENLPSEYIKLAKEETGIILEIFERVFDHKSFTGRSGTFYGYEGLGSIYWHMVSKLLLASSGFKSTIVKLSPNACLYVSIFLFTSRQDRITILGNNDLSRCLLRSSDVIGDT